MEATAWLGHWYREVAQNYSKARNCYKKVLASDPNNTVIGEHLLPTIPLCMYQTLRRSLRTQKYVCVSVLFKLVIQGHVLECSGQYQSGNHQAVRQRLLFRSTLFMHSHRMV